MKTLEVPSKHDIIFEEMQAAVADAIETHRRMGRSIVVWRDGKVTHIKPADIAPRALPHDALERAEWEKY